MKTADFHKATLVSLKFDTDTLVEEIDVFTGKEVLTTDPGPIGTLVFVVRRPGWPLVRGDARILQSKINAGEFQGFHVRSIVKETGIDDQGLNEFVTEYFPYSTYKDQARTFYDALGSGKMSIGFNPLAMVRLITDSMTRMKELDVKTYNAKGEGFLQGGWILFDPSGTPRAAFQENAKKRVPINDILEEVQFMRSNNNSTLYEEKEIE